MEIHKKEDESKGSLYIENNGEKKAEMFYTKAGPDRIIINHTEVKPDFKGNGAGLALVTEAVKQARENKISIIPLCSYARKVFMDHPEFSDVL